MDDHQKKSSWDDLLQDLGAKPEASAYQRHQPPAQEILPAAEPSRARDVAAESRPAVTSDWNSLAESLGIEVREPVPPGQVATPSATPEVAAPIAQQPLAEEHGASDAPEFSAAAVAGPLGGNSKSGNAQSGNVPSGSEAQSEDDFSDDDFSDDDFVAADESPDDDPDDDFDDDDFDDDDFDDDADENAVSEFESQRCDELPPLPSQMDQVLSDTAWSDDQDEQQEGADSASADATVDESESAGISGEAARSAFDALFADGASGWGSAFLDRPKPVDERGSLINAIESESSFEDERSESHGSATDRLGRDELDDDDESEKPKRKRSRRRRRGGKGRRPASDPAVGEVAAAGHGNTETDAAPADATDSQEELGEAVAGKQAKRPRRSRSRRGTRPPEVKDNRVRGNLDDGDDDDLDDDLDGDQADGDLGENSPRGAARGRKRHSNLPTWSDAIGMIVDGNLEQRAKSPSKPQSSRGRGGRGGGRRRSSKRPESK